MAYLGRTELLQYFCMGHHTERKSYTRVESLTALFSLFQLSLTCLHHPFQAESMRIQGRGSHSSMHQILTEPSSALHLLLSFRCWLQRKQGETPYTSHADLADIFGWDWIKRIWTY
jgi:hypothetical protein